MGPPAAVPQGSWQRSRQRRGYLRPYRQRNRFWNDWNRTIPPTAEAPSWPRHAPQQPTSMAPSSTTFISLPFEVVENVLRFTAVKDRQV